LRRLKPNQNKAHEIVTNSLQYRDSIENVYTQHRNTLNIAY